MNSIKIRANDLLSQTSFTHSKSINDHITPQSSTAWVSMIYTLLLFQPHLAPRTPPENLISPSQTHNSISLQWDRIPFLDQNGPNFRYAVFYRVFGSGDSLTNITAETNTTTIQNLMSFTTYSIFIRAQNDIGVGRPSNTIQARTLAARELHSS